MPAAFVLAFVVLPPLLLVRRHRLANPAASEEGLPKTRRDLIRLLT